MAFKPKPDKKINSAPIITLDKTHEQKLEQFHHNETIKIPELEKQCQELEENGEDTLQLRKQIQKLKNAIFLLVNLLIRVNLLFFFL